MKSNSNKQLRDKLTGVEFPFDPQAWEQMEDLLKKKKKRRGFFWWWTGGIAAALLFAVVGYELGVNSGNKQIATNNEQKTEAKSNLPKYSISEQAGKPEVNTLVTVGSNSKQESVNGNEQEGATNNKQIVKSKGQKANGKKASVENPTASILENSSDASSPSSDVLSKKQKRKQKQLAKANEGMANTTLSSSERNPLQEKTDLLASSTTKDLLAKRIEMDGRAGFLESAEDENSFNKKSEESLPKIKKTIFNYSLGVMANVTGTTLGSQSENRPERPALFYNRPSYAVGFTHEFLFLKRIAITNSVLYSQTGLKVYQPSAPADSSTITKNYSAAISELQIPFGIKAYPVIKKYFRFSIAAGIINHIKLKEKFTVEQETPPVNSILTPLENTNVFVADNPFTGANKSLTVEDAAYTHADQAEYFGMGGLKRYYTSFYASAGVEFIAKKHFVFFTEPMFYMSLNKIGWQDKRKYNVGVSGGFRYQF